MNSGAWANEEDLFHDHTPPALMEKARRVEWRRTYNASLVCAGSVDDVERLHQMAAAQANRAHGPLVKP